jgi:OOP family OmpA-OmpF porin
MSDSPPPRRSGSDVDGQTPNGDRLASLLIGIARYVDPVTAPGLPAPSGDPSLDAVRHILLDRELQVLARLRRTIDDPERLAATVSEVLSLAVQRAAARDGRLGESLTEAVERAAQCSIKKDPRTFIGIFSPLMGATIRKSIAETLESTLQSLNQALKHSLSWRGLLWRIEARRAGTTFANVVLRHTLVYRVEHVFLIHKESGLLISHVAADNAAIEDPQLVSGMLTAIQDFVRDSFGRAEATGLDTLRLGDQVLWCEQARSLFSPPSFAARRLKRSTARFARRRWPSTTNGARRSRSSPVTMPTSPASPIACRRVCKRNSALPKSACRRSSGCCRSCCSCSPATGSMSDMKPSSGSTTTSRGSKPSLGSSSPAPESATVSGR